MGSCGAAVYVDGHLVLGRRGRLGGGGLGRDGVPDAVARDLALGLDERLLRALRALRWAPPRLRRRWNRKQRRVEQEAFLHQTVAPQGEAFLYLEGDLSEQDVPGIGVFELTDRLVARLTRKGSGRSARGQRNAATGQWKAAKAINTTTRQYKAAEAQ